MKCTNDTDGLLRHPLIQRDRKSIIEAVVAGVRKARGLQNGDILEVVCTPDGVITVTHRRGASGEEI